MAYDECELLLPFVAAGKAVFHVEYVDEAAQGQALADQVCPAVPDGFSTLIFPDVTFRVPTGWDRYKKRLQDTFPGEADALGKVVDILIKVAADSRRLQSGEVSESTMFTELPLFFEWGIRPITDLFGEFGISQRASAVILGEQGDYAVRPSRTAVALHAGLTDHYMRGAYYPEGGGQMLAARLVEAIRAYGGEVRVRSRVRNVRIESGRAVGVTLDKDGAEIDAPIVVSNADLKRTVNELVGREHFAPATVERVDSFRMSLPLFIVYLGVDVDYVAQGLPNTNYFMWDTYDIEGIYETLENGHLARGTLFSLHPELSHTSTSSRTTRRSSQSPPAQGD